MSGMESDLLMGFIGKAKRKKPTVNSWVHIVAGQDHFSVVQLDQRGVVKQDPVKATKNSHCSLRRLMVAHYLKFKRKGKMPYPLASMFEVL